MDYICVDCKCKHDSKDIGFCFPDAFVDSTIDKIIAKLADSDVDDAVGNYITTQKNRIFTIRGQEAAFVLSNPNITNNNQLCDLSGNLAISIEWVIQRLDNCLDDKEKSDVISSLKEDASKKIEDLPIVLFRYLLSQKELIPLLTMIDGDVQYTRRCPFCGRELCRSTGFHPEISIILQGNTRAGKTACLAALGYQLDKPAGDIGPRLVIPQNDPMLSDLRSQIRNRFSRSLRVVKTDRSQEVYVYSFNLEVAQKEYVLTMIDMPGEFFDADGMDRSWIKQYAPLYQHANAIWTVIDKLTLREIKDENIAREAGIPTEVISNLTWRDYQSILSEISNITGTDTPSAIIITKTDVANNEKEDVTLFPFGANITERNQRLLERIWSQGYYQEENAFRCSVEVRNYFARFNTDLFNTFKAAFHKCSFFAVSAYGHSAIQMPEDAATDEKNQAEAELKKYVEVYEQKKKHQRFIIDNAEKRIAKFTKKMQSMEKGSVAWNAWNSENEKCVEEKRVASERIEFLEAEEAAGRIPFELRISDAEEQLEALKNVTPDKLPTPIPPAPYGVELPLLWSLAVSDMISIQYAVEKEVPMNFWQKILHFFGLFSIKTYSEKEIHTFSNSDHFCKSYLFMQKTTYTGHTI